jgi:hypothetical protein
MNSLGFCRLNSTNLNQVKAKRIEYKNNVMEVIEDEEIFHQRFVLLTKLLILRFTTVV